MRTEELMRFSPRDEAILHALSRKVRLLSLAQIARHWWSHVKAPEDAARRRLRELELAGWIVCVQPQARRLPPIIAPVVGWSPKQQAPDFSDIAQRLQCRWQGETVRVRAYVLGPTADLGVSEMYLNLLGQRPADAERWLGEDELAPYRQHEKLPDAVLADSPQARPELVLEFGGAYDARRVQQFHEDCAEQLLPYEIW
jgi:hypothetical protein